MLAAGQFAWSMIEPMAEADRFERQPRCRLPLARWAAGEYHGQFDVLQRRPRQNQVEGLKDHAGHREPMPRQSAGSELGQLAATDLHAAGGGRVESAEQIK